MLILHAAWADAALHLWGEVPAQPLPAPGRGRRARREAAAPPASPFAEMGELLKGHLQKSFGREIHFLHGGTPKAQRDRMVEAFQNDAGVPPVFVLSLKAGGTGLTLTRASHVSHRREAVEGGRAGRLG